MPMHLYTRSKGQRLTYAIAYDKGEYFIQRDGIMKKSVPDAFVAAVADAEATPNFMLRTAISDIERLIGMEE